MNRIVRGLVLLSAIVLLAGLAGGQNVPALDSMKSPEELNKAVTTLDASVFDAFNRCEVDKFATFFTEDVEFYHDRDGLSVGKADLAESIKKNICGKVTRELVSGTLQIYPLPGYGAVETGVHRFHHPGHDDTEPVGEGKFLHVWQCKNGQWKITRVISYDHHALAK